MSTTSSCRREEVVSCQPDRTIVVEPKQDAHPAASECAMISEKQFMRDHTIYSAVSSWLFAIAGATNIGLLSVWASKLLSGVEQGKPLFKSNNPAVTPVFGNKKYNRISAAMMAFGGACMAVSNWLESKKVVTEWQLGAGKLQRKAHIAESESAQAAVPVAPGTADMPVTQTPEAGACAKTTRSKSWRASVQPQEPVAGEQEQSLAQR